MKITKTFGDLSFESEFEHLEDVENWLKKLVKWHEKTCPPVVLRGIAPSKKELDVLRVYASKVGSIESMLDWIKAEDKAHAERWICKYSGFSNAKQLLAQLERTGDLKWHECLYKGSNGHWQTMKGAFLDGDAPIGTTASVEQVTIVEWVMSNPGYMSPYVEQNCGVIRSNAKIQISRLITEGFLEMRTHVTKVDKFGVWVV